MYINSIRIADDLAKFYKPLHRGTQTKQKIEIISSGSRFNNFCVGKNQLKRTVQ